MVLGIPGGLLERMGWTRFGRTTGRAGRRTEEYYWDETLEGFGECTESGTYVVPGKGAYPTGGESGGM